MFFNRQSVAASSIVANLQRSYFSTNYTGKYSEDESKALEEYYDCYQAKKFVAALINKLNCSHEEAKKVLSFVLLPVKRRHFLDGYIASDFVFNEYILDTLIKDLDPETILLNSNLFFSINPDWVHFFSLRQAKVKLKLDHFYHPQEKIWNLSMKEWHDRDLVSEDVNLVENIIDSMIRDESERYRVFRKLRQHHSNFHTMPLVDVNTIIRNIMFSEIRQDKIENILRLIFPKLKYDLPLYTSLFYPHTYCPLGYLLLANPLFFSTLKPNKPRLRDALMLQIAILPNDFSGLTVENIVLNSNLFRKRISPIIACLNEAKNIDNNLQNLCLLSAISDSYEQNSQSFLMNGTPLTIEVKPELEIKTKQAIARLVSYLLLERLKTFDGSININILKDKIFSLIDINRFNVSSIKNNLDRLCLQDKLTYNDFINCNDKLSEAINNKEKKVI